VTELLWMSYRDFCSSTDPSLAVVHKDGDRVCVQREIDPPRRADWGCDEVFGGSRI